MLLSLLVAVERPDCDRRSDKPMDKSSEDSLVADQQPCALSSALGTYYDVLIDGVMSRVRSMYVVLVVQGSAPCASVHALLGHVLGMDMEYGYGYGYGYGYWR